MPNCGHAIRVPDEARERPVRCPGCTQVQQVPKEAAPVETGAKSAIEETSPIVVEQEPAPEDGNTTDDSLTALAAAVGESTEVELPPLSPILVTHRLTMLLTRRMVPRPLTRIPTNQPRKNRTRTRLVAQPSPCCLARYAASYSQ